MVVSILVGVVTSLVALVLLLLLLLLLLLSSCSSEDTGNITDSSESAMIVGARSIPVSNKNCNNSFLSVRRRLFSSLLRFNARFKRNTKERNSSKLNSSSFPWFGEDIPAVEEPSREGVSGYTEKRIHYDRDVEKSRK